MSGNGSGGRGGLERGDPGRGGHGSGQGPGFNNGARPRREGGLDGQDRGQWRSRRSGNFNENNRNNIQERGLDGQDRGQWRSQRGGNFNENNRNNNQEHGRDRNQWRDQRGRHNNQNTGNDYPEGPNSPQQENIRGNNNSERRYNGPRRERTMGFQYVQSLLENRDIQQVMFEISDDKKGFSKLLDSKELSNDLIVLLVKLIRNVCDSTFQAVKLNLLNAALTSRFMEKLIVFITGIYVQTERDKKFNKHLWNDPDEFWNALLDISKTVQELTPTNGTSIKQLLNTMTVFFPLIESAHSMHISDGIKAKTLSLCELVEKTISDLEVKQQRALNNIPLDDDLEPPDDFHQIPIIPSVLEVVTEERPFLRANIVNKAFRSVNDYLDIQFRLLREDFVAPLRRGICTYLRNQQLPKNEQKKLENIKVYNPIRFVSVEAVNECNCYKMRYDFSMKKQSFTYENSKKFMFGSLVCFTNDNFQSLLFGKIVQRDQKLLEAGLLIVGFQEDVQVNFQTDYLMVESSVYFEPYYQVLNVLKLMKTDNFPMERYIINVETSSRAPEYLYIQGPINYTVESSTFMPLNFPRQRFYSLNDSQLNAFKAALTDEFCIIQGPPGTGKTYLGLKIAHTLLQNAHAWYRKTPILVICFTNHALDQFLEGLLPITDNILRVGGRSKNETLQRYNLNIKRTAKGQQAAVAQKRRAVRDYVQQSKTLNQILSEIDANETILNFDCFQNIDDKFKDSWFDTAEAEDIIKWLLEGKNRHAVRNRNIRREEQDRIIGVNQVEVERPEDFDEDNDREENEIMDDTFNNIATKLERHQGQLIELQHLREKLNRYNEELQRLKTKPQQLDILLHREKIETEVWETETDLEYLTAQMEYFNDPKHRRRPRDIDFQNPRTMLPDKRWELYYYWLDLYTNDLRKQYENRSEQFRTLYQEYSQMRDMEDTQLMMQHLVVGMTTTGAARLQASLQALKSPIVIVEEAAEVLEAHIVAALTKHCQHLILIGDHLQLKPGAADYNIETKFKLGISLFERMVKNNIKCHTLNVQHRMRPEISKLIKPHIYRDLVDHESTLQRNSIIGVEKCLYFIDHREPENICQDASKKNPHEAKFLIALARHLILNGYKPEQITILAAYLGQSFEMMREKKKDENKLLLQDVRISVLDNYQGEESDIILLSLVRSNKDNKAGFLRIQNRVCVALSRARNGFYIMGNMSLLLKSDSENQIWEKVNTVLKEQNAIGNHLNLRCQVHRYRFTPVRSGKDFVNLSEGGCDLLCEATVGCGHICKRLCHVQDRDHQLYKCNEKCNRFMCNDLTHKCPKLCYQECGPCSYPVPRKLDCGHLVRIACHIDPTQYKCQVLVPTRLPCDHEVPKPCFMDPEQFLCPTNCDTRVEPCGHPCSRLCHIRVDPDHLEYKCREPCAKPRHGCREPMGRKHICPKYCFQECEECTIGVMKTRSCGHLQTLSCKEDVEEFLCQKPCKKELICGHPCRNKCFEDCGACQNQIVKYIPDCGHPIKIECHKTPERRQCLSTKCSRILPCGHKCKAACKDVCTQQCMEFIECNVRAPCGHIVKKIMCHLRFTTDPKILLKYCTEPCGAELSCKTREQAHKCSGTCGECMQGRIHKRCGEKCGVPLVCNHECPIPCRQACKPCTMPCQMKCAHNKCKKKCGEPCTPCQARCKRRCKHVTCTRACGEICSVGPCEEKCPKIRKCGHPCVGFCGDPCPPLCGVCNHEELTEIFFGTEEDEGKVFVLLEDCGHVLEHSGLENWLNEGENEIAFKTCPRCKTNIASTERYSDYIKQSIDDVMKAKEKQFGIQSENEAMQKKLTEELTILKGRCPRTVSMACPSLQCAIDTLLKRLEPVRGKRRQPINQVELNAIQSKTQTLSYIIQCFKDVKKTFERDDASIEHLTVLLKVLLRSDDHVTDQEVKDLEMEIKRLHRIVQYDNIHKSGFFPIAITKSDILNLGKSIQDILFNNSRYTEFLDNWIKTKMSEFASKVDSTMTISDTERIEIVRAMNLSQGHWFKCPNGHPYTIGECGGAMVIAKCFCGAQIGGTGHALLRDNALASEMDGARRSAWPGQLYGPLG